MGVSGTQIWGIISLFGIEVDFQEFRNIAGLIIDNLQAQKSLFILKKGKFKP